MTPRIEGLKSSDLVGKGDAYVVFSVSGLEGHG